MNLFLLKIHLMDELNAELEEDEADYVDNQEDEFYDEEVDEEPVVTNINEETPSRETFNEQVEQILNEEDDDLFKEFESGEINFDKENEELDDTIGETDQSEKEQKELLEKLKVLVRQKIQPVTKTFDISSFSISKRPAARSISTPRDNGQKTADWVLMNSQKPIYMTRFTGTELERLYNGGKGRTRLNKELDQWQLIYNHIVDPHKPDTLEQWAKATSFLDVDHIYMAIYRANFEGSNYMPFQCTNKSCKDKVFVSDNINIMDMCKFATKEDKLNKMNYKYPHDYGGYVEQQYLPDSLKGRVYYQPKDVGFEKTVKQIRKLKGKD